MEKEYRYCLKNEVSGRVLFGSVWAATMREARKETERKHESYSPAWYISSVRLAY